MATTNWINLSESGVKVTPSQKEVLSSGYRVKENGGKVGTTCIRYSLNGFWHHEGLYGQAGKSTFDLPGAGCITEVGMPMLLQEGLLVALPANAVFEGVEYIGNKEEMIAGDYDVLPAPAPVLDGIPARFIPNGEVYHSGDEYPASPVRYIGLTDVAGISCAHLLFYPQRYSPESKKISVLTDGEIRVTYTYAGLGASREITDSRLAGMLLGYDAQASALGGIEKMLVITPKEFEMSIKKYTNAMEALYDVETIFYEDILRDFKQRTNYQSIYECVMAKFAKQPFQYLMLVGDHAKLPAADARDVTGLVPGVFLSDSYYSRKMMDGLPRSAYMPLFCVSRFPAANTTELDRQINLALAYCDNYTAERKKSIFTASLDDDDNDDMRKRYINQKQSLGATTLKYGIGSSFRVSELYDGDVFKSVFTNEINKSEGFINYCGHGAWNGWSAFDFFMVADVKKLSYTGKSVPIVLGICCSTNDLSHSDCFGATWIKNQKAIAYLGASTEVLSFTNGYFDKYLWEMITLRRYTKIGDIYYMAAIQLAIHQPEDATHTNFLAFLLLGDPTADYRAFAKQNNYKSDLYGTVPDMNRKEFDASLLATNNNRKITQIHVRSGDTVDGIGLVYLEGVSVFYGSATTGNLFTIRLSEDEYIKEISGNYHGTFYHGISNISIITNRSKYGPYGKIADGTKFSLNKTDCMITALFGSTGIPYGWKTEVVAQLGAYFEPLGNLYK